MPGQPKGLPYAPLEFSDQVILPTGEVAGHAVLSELPATVAVPVWDVLRAVLLSATKAASPASYAPATLKGWEEGLLRASERAPGEAPLWDALAVVVHELSRKAKANHHRLSQACLAVADWALGQGHTETSLAFHEAAALAFPENARFAVLAGRAYRRHGRLRQAEPWLKRAILLSRAFKDWETHALAVNTLGMVHWVQGSNPKALGLLHRARRVARRHGHRTLEGEILHNLMVVAMTSGDAAKVAPYASAAFDRYLPSSHQRLPALAYDLAYYWLTCGYAARSLPILLSLKPHFNDPPQLAQLLSATARAAGACQMREPFDEAWDGAFRIIGAGEVGLPLSAVLIDLGFGAAHFGLFPEAESAFARALSAAEECGEYDNIVRADACIAAVRGAHNPDTITRPQSVSGAQQETEEFAQRFVKALSTG